MQTNLRIYNQLIKLVTDGKEVYSVFPFPIVAGHDLLHKLINEYAVFDEESVDTFGLILTRKYDELIENIKKGCHLDKFNFYPDKYTLLHYSCYYENLEITKLLLEENAQVDILDINNNTPLLLTLFDINIFDLLLSHGANINHQNTDGNTVLMCISSHNTNNLQYLIDKKADVEIKNNEGMSAIQIASFYHIADNIKILTKYAKYDKNNLLDIARINYSRNRQKVIDLIFSL